MKVKTELMDQPVKPVQMAPQVKMARAAKPVPMAWMELPAQQELMDQLVPLVNKVQREQPDLPVQQVKREKREKPEQQDPKDQQDLALTF
jgi:hypothetical protein